MFKKYMIVSNTNMAEENVILINRDEYNVFVHEPITDSDNKDEALSLLREVKTLGVFGYLDKIGVNDNGIQAIF